MSLFDDFNSGTTDIFGLISSTANSVGDTSGDIAYAETGVNAALNGGNNPAAQAQSAQAVAAQQSRQPGSVPAGSLFSSSGVNALFSGLTSNPTVLLIVVATIAGLLFLRA